jgi:transketolase
MEQRRIIELKIIAAKIRRHVVEGVYNAGCGHPGGSLSIADLLALLYFEVMNVDPQNPKMEERDRLVLSKGHCAPGLYGALAEKGYFPKEEIKKLRQVGSMLQGHPDEKSTPGVDACSGSLGQGISIAVGMAIAAKKMGKGYRIYTILGDGEIQEGQVWEAAMCAAHYKLDNLTAFVDFNGMQIDGYVKDVMSPLPIDEKFKAFGWNVVHCDGHDYNQLDDAIRVAKGVLLQPTLVLMRTIKGKGVSYMENNLAWHGMAPNQEQYRQAMAELDQRIEELERELA